LSLRQLVSLKVGFSNPGGSSFIDPSGIEPNRENDHPVLKDSRESFGSLPDAETTFEQESKNNITMGATIRRFIFIINILQNEYSCNGT
jgi:hypothetical protein